MEEINLHPSTEMFNRKIITEEYINQEIAFAVKHNIETPFDTNKISDGYHTFGEVYNHRIALYIALCRKVQKMSVPLKPVWRSTNHSDGNACFDGGWFILGIFKEPGTQISYHLPMTLWDKTGFAILLDRAPEWDGHTPQQVLERLELL